MSKFNKNNLIALLIGLLVSLIALSFIYRDHMSIRSEQLPPYAAVPEVVDGELYSQRFVCTENSLNKILFLSATYSRANSGTLSVTLEDDSHNEIQSWSFDSADITDNSYLELPLDSRIDDSKDRVFYLNISTDSQPGSAPTFYTTYYGGSKGLSLNGEDLGISLCYMLDYELPASSLLNAKMILISLLILLLIPGTMLLFTHMFPLEKMGLIVFPELAAVLGVHRLMKHAVFSAFPPVLMASLFLALCILWVTGCIVFYRLIVIKKISVQKLAVISLVIFSLFTILFLTPGTGNDEQTHYSYAYKYANIFSFKGFSDPVDEDGNILIYMRDEDAELLTTMRDVPIYLSEGSYKGVIKSFSLFSKDNSLHAHRLIDTAGIGGFGGNNVPLGYIMSGMGIALGRLLHLGAVPTFYLGRIFNTALFIFLVYLSIKIIPVGKETLFVISLFPMVLQQSCTYSYDSIIIGLIFLFTAMTVSVFRSDDKITAKQLIILALLSVAVAISKFVYAPLILILLALPSDRLNVKNPKAVKAGFIAGVTVLGIIGFAVLQHFMSVLSFFVPSYAGEETTLFTTVVRYFEMFQMTAVEVSDFYLRSLIAYPGWYQIYVPFTVFSVYYLLLIFSMARKDGENRFPGTGTRIWAAVLMIISVLLITLPMASKFTNPGSDTISSIQGRYFIPLIPMLCMGIRMKHVTADDSLYNKVLFGTVYMSFLFFGFCFLELFNAI